MFELALTHYQLVALLLLDLLHDPELIKHFISVLKASEIDDARAFHFHNKCENIFNHKRKSISFRKNILYFRNGFLQKYDFSSNIDTRHIPLTISESIYAVRNMFDRHTLDGELFRRYYSFLSIEECFRNFSSGKPGHLIINVSKNYKECSIGFYIESVYLV